MELGVLRVPKEVFFVLALVVFKPIQENSLLQWKDYH